MVVLDVAIVNVALPSIQKSLHFSTAGVYQYKSVEQGAATSVLVATSPQLDGIGGRYFQDCNEAPVVDPATAEETGAGVAGYAVDPVNAERLWQLSAATLD